MTRTIIVRSHVETPQSIFNTSQLPWIENKYQNATSYSKKKKENEEKKIVPLVRMC